MAKSSRAHADGSSAAHHQRHTFRTIVVGLLVAGASVSLVMLTVVQWTEKQILNTENWVSFMAPLPKNPAVVEALSSFVASRVFDSGQVEQKVQNALPDKASFLAEPLTNQLEQLTKTATARVITSDQFQSIWIAANRIAHQRLLERARGGTAEPSPVSQKFQLNLDDMRPRVQQALGKAAAALPDRPQPLEIDADTHTRPQYLQKVVTTMDTLQRVLPWLLVATLVGALVWSRNRRRTLLAFGIASLVLALLQLIGIKMLRPEILNTIENGSYRAAGAVLYDSLVQSFNSQVYGVLMVVLGLIVVCLLAGHNRAGTLLRRWLRWDAFRRTRYYKMWQNTRLWLGAEKALVWGAMIVAALAYLAFVADPVDAKTVGVVLLMVLSGMGVVVVMGTPPYLSVAKKHE